MTPIGWKIWYSNSTFDSTQGTWGEAPDTDVQCVVLYYAEMVAEGIPYRDLFMGADYYAYDGNRFYLREDDARSEVKDELIGHIKTGRWTTDENYQDIIMHRAMDDMGEGWLFENRKIAAPDEKPDDGVNDNTGLRAA